MKVICLNKKVVLITGCGSGIGLELARLIAKDKNYIPVITARKKHLEFLKQEFSFRSDILIHELDVTDELQIYNLINLISEKYSRIDIVVNNAAICYRSVVEHMDTESERLQIETNYIGPMNIIRSVIPIMREQKCGHIINVSSASGILSMPTMASYSASKSALRGATEALWYEAYPFGIKVNLIELGFINSSGHEHVVYTNKAKLSIEVDGPHSEYYSSMGPFVSQLMRWSIHSSVDVAQKIKKNIDKPSSKIFIRGTIDIFFYQVLRYIIPQSIFNRVLYYLLPGSLRWGESWKNFKDRLIS